MGIPVVPKDLVCAVAGHLQEAVAGIHQRAVWKGGIGYHKGVAKAG